MGDANLTEQGIMEPTHIQLEQVNSLVSAAGVDGARAILDAFQRSTIDLLSALNEDIRSGAMDEALRSAHAVKGSAANVGAQLLAETAEAIEAACSAGDNSEAAGKLIEAQSRFDAFCVHFEAHLAQY